MPSTFANEAPSRPESTLRCEIRANPSARHRSLSRALSLEVWKRIGFQNWTSAAVKTLGLSEKPIRGPKICRNHVSWIQVLYYSRGFDDLVEVSRVLHAEGGGSRATKNGGDCQRRTGMLKLSKYWIFALEHSKCCHISSKSCTSSSLAMRFLSNTLEASPSIMPCT